MCASRHRSPAPIEPVRGTIGWTPAFSIAANVSATAREIPAPPAQNPFSRTSIAARTAALGIGSPTAVARPRMIRADCSRACSGGSGSTTRAPSPVVSPYTGRPSASARSSTVRADAMRARAAGAISTVRPEWATSATPAGVRVCPVRRSGCDGSKMPQCSGCVSWNL